LPAEIQESLLRAEPALLTAAFAAAEKAYGSLDLYFERAMGLDAAARACLCEALLE
jgi:protein-tyrosine phosphatase